MSELGDLGDALPFPLQHALTETVAITASEQEREDLMPLWAGQSIGLCLHIQASELMAEMIAKADASTGR